VTSPNAVLNYFVLMSRPALPPPSRPLNEFQRSAILDQTLMHMSAGGMVRIESRMPTWAVVVSGQRVNTVAHLLATVFLCGLWLPFWIIAETTGGEKRSTISVDEWGRVDDSLRRRTVPSQRSSNQNAALIIGGLVGMAILMLILTAMLHR
jgi:hypothetical protein